MKSVLLKETVYGKLLELKLEFSSNFGRQISFNELVETLINRYRDDESQRESGDSR